jgi:hypothetical protein
MRIVSWNVARRSSRLAEQAAALAQREPDVVALQEITRRASTFRTLRTGGSRFGRWRGSRFGLASARRAPRVLCGDLNTPRRELPDGDVITFARDSRSRLRPERGSEGGRSRAGRGGGSPATTAAGVWTTCSSRRSFARFQPPTTTHGASGGSAITQRSRSTCGGPARHDSLGCPACLAGCGRSK